MNEPRQRWRLVVARGPAARDLVHREVAAAWEAGLAASDLPLSMTEGGNPRPRVSFGAPAPVGMLAEGELIDVVLTELVPLERVRTAIGAAAPSGYRCVDLFDVWLGAPSLPSMVVAGEYRAAVRADDGGAVEETVVAAAVADLLAATRIEVTRTRGAGDVVVDIRPQIQDVRVGAPRPGGHGAPGGEEARFDLWMRLRLGGEAGVGRPEEVVAVLGERLGRRLVALQLARERIVLADDPDA